MSHPDPRHDPENVRSEDSKFAPRAKTKALKRFRNKIDKRVKIGHLRKDKYGVHEFIS